MAPPRVRAWVPLALFAASIEEIGGSGRARPRPACPWTAGVATSWPGHPQPRTVVSGLATNDLTASRGRVVAIEWRVPGEPVVLSIGIGPWISVGWNFPGCRSRQRALAQRRAGGCPAAADGPRQATARTLDEAVGMALRPYRSSSYNTVFAHRDGRVVNVEGSARCGTRRPGRRPARCPSNHYACERMRRYEGDPAYAREISGQAGSGAGTARRGRRIRVPAPASISLIAGGDPRRPATTPSICRHDESTRDIRDRLLVHRRRHRRRDPLRPREPVRTGRGALSFA